MSRIAGKECVVLMIKRLREICIEIEQYMPYLKNVADKYEISLAQLKIDYLFCRLLHGSLVEQYVAFEMWKMNCFERKQFVTAKRSAKIEKMLNEHEDVRISNKHLFNKAFHKYVKRDWIYVPECSEDDTRKFVQQNEWIIIKPSNSYQGKGIRKESSLKILQDDFSSFYTSCLDERCVLEAVIKQHHVLEAINPSSVNTIRVCTVRDQQGQVHVVGASLRVGRKGSVVDNFHAGSVQYAISVENGIVISGGVTCDGMHSLYYHPDTQVKMIGLEIPNWDIVLGSVKEAAKIPEHLRYLGWDVAVLEEGCEIIEANTGQGCNGMQQDKIGKYSIIKSYF